MNLPWTLHFLDPKSLRFEDQIEPFLDGLCLARNLRTLSTSNLRFHFISIRASVLDFA